MQNRTRAIPEINFTDSAYSVLYDVVDDPYFIEKDADAIYTALRRRLKAIPFGEYLMRYLYRAAGMTEPFGAVLPETYRRIITESFRETMTPPSFSPTSVKMSVMAKNWLTQKSVRREVVLLLGFGLKMSEEDVNEMLYKALKEDSLNPDDPMELIAWYCYRNRLVYPRFLQIRQIYKEASGIPEDLPAGDRAFLLYLIRRKQEGATGGREETIRKTFDSLFREAQKLAAGILGFPVDRVTEADLEGILCAAVPKDAHGNLSPAKKSMLNAHFSGKRLSRQRLHRIRSGKDMPDRFDLITLAFFIASQQGEADRKKRYAAFLDETNTLLESCGFGPLYVANPYECFILMCILSVDPLATYCDVWELSYGAPDPA